MATPSGEMVIGSYGEKLVYGCFKKIARRGESVDIYKEFISGRYALNKGTCSTLKLFSSTEEDPEYITDPTCMHSHRPT